MPRHKPFRLIDKVGPNRKLAAWAHHNVPRPPSLSTARRLIVQIDDPALLRRRLVELRNLAIENIGLAVDDDNDPEIAHWIHVADAIQGHIDRLPD